MNKNISAILIISFLIFSNIAINVQQTYYFQGSTGIYTPIISAQPQIGNDPSQYFLCGFAFRQMKWQKLLNNCNCGNRLQGFSYVYKCDWCSNVFWTMSNGFKAMFCHYSDWTKQIIRTFQTGNTDSRDWRQFKCPKNTYASFGAARLAQQLQTDIGFVGMHIQCSTPDFISNYQIKDNYKYPLTQFSTNDEGTFVSGIQIKYEPKGKLTGINLIFERMAMISQILIKYDARDSNKPTTKKLIENQAVTNLNNDFNQTPISFTNTYQTVNSWYNDLNYIKGYQLQQGTFLTPPKLNNNQSQNNKFLQNSDIFGFDKSIKTIMKPQSSLVLLIKPKTIMNINIIVQQLKDTQKYQMTLTFVDMLNGLKIMQKNVSGIWAGYYYFPVQIQTNQTPISSISSPFQYYNYLPIRFQDNNSFKWTGKYGGSGGSYTASTDIPAGYFLVGASMRCGTVVDQITFEYSSSKKDLITQGPYGGNSGGLMSFRSDYTNEQWINRINIYWDGYYITGLQFITNKNTVSQKCGLQQKNKQTLTAKWFRGVKTTSIPYLHNFQIQYKE